MQNKAAMLPSAVESRTHQTSQPPSTVTDWPVMFFESSEAR